MGHSLSRLYSQIYEFFDTHYPPLPKWSTRDISDLSGKVALVTGVTIGGIGFEIAKELLIKNARVYIAGRNLERLQDAEKELTRLTARPGTTSSAHILVLDLGDQESVLKAAARFIKQEGKLDILINNAAVFLAPLDRSTTDTRLDITLGTNLVGPCLLTLALRPALIKSKKSRIVNVTSDAYHWAPHHAFESLIKLSPWCTSVDALEGTDELAEYLRWKTDRETFGKLGLYALSKFGIMMFTLKLAKEWADEGVVTVAVHPGTIRSNCYNLAPWWTIVLQPFMWPTQYGALTPLYAATSDNVESGQYYRAFCQLRTVNDNLRRSLKEDGTAFWDWIQTFYASPTN